MTEEIERLLRVRLADIEGQLEEVDLFRDYKAVLRVLEMAADRKFGGDTKRGDSVAETRERPTSSFAPAADMKNAAADVLQGRSSPLSTKAIYDHLVTRGVEVPGENPTNNLSAHLSRDARFLSWGREGWTLSSTVQADFGAVDAVARDFVQQLDLEAREDLERKVRESSSVPSPLDGELLRYARSRFGRHLKDDEKRRLRDQVVSIGGDVGREDAQSDDGNGV